MDNYSDKKEDKQELLKKYKKWVFSSKENFRKNYERFWESKNFTLRTSLTDRDRNYLKILGKPDLEANIGEAKVSRLIGEFAKQAPVMIVSASDDVPETPELEQQIHFVDGYLRHVITDANNEGCTTEVYKDQMFGGFSCFEAYSEYADEMSFKQVLGIRKVPDPTLIGWDPLANLPHKGDGRYCFKITPKIDEDFKAEYPKVDISQLKFTKEISGFNWSYNNGKENVILICDLYYKDKERVKIVELSAPLNGEIRMTEKQYKKELKAFLALEPLIIPPIVVKSRITDLITIRRCRFIETQMLEDEETDYKMFPLVFVDGNSSMLRENMDSNIAQFCKPFLYHARGIQKLKNFSMQTLGNQLETITQSKMAMAIASLPEKKEYLDAILSPQSPNVTLYNHLDPKTQQPIPAPIFIQPAPIPPEITNTFQICDQSMQMILGSFDAAEGNISPNDLSGKAVLEAASQSNQTAMPFLLSFLIAWNRLAEILVDQIPKKLVEERKIPIITKNNERTVVRINPKEGREGINMNYAPNALQVKVEPGVNFSIQKFKALQLMINMMQVSPLFAEFMSSQYGMPILLGNLEIKDADLLKSAFNQFMQFKQQQAQQQMEMQKEMMKNDPRFIAAQASMVAAQAKAEKDRHEVQHSVVEDDQKAAQQAIEATQAQNDRLATIAKIVEAEEESVMKKAQMQTELLGKAVDLSIEAAKHSHQIASDHRTHHREDVKTAHSMLMDHLTRKDQKHEAKEAK